MQWPVQSLTPEAHVHLHSFPCSLGHAFAFALAYSLSFLSSACNVLSTVCSAAHACVCCCVADSDTCAELLTQASRQMLVEMVYLLFQRIGDLPDTAALPGASATHAARLQVNSEGLFLLQAWHDHSCCDVP